MTSSSPPTPSRPPSLPRWASGPGAALVLLAFLLIPAGASFLFSEEPRVRRIHVESFRYGKSPHVIRANRGDRLELSFSTRDTAHSFYLEELDVDAKVEPGSRSVRVFSVADPEAGSRREEEVVLRAEAPGRFGFLYSKFQIRCHVWCGPLHSLEQASLVLSPNPLLFAGWG